MLKTFTKVLLVSSVLLISIFSSTKSTAQCATTSWTFSPAPVNDAYVPGQVISVCIHLSYYQQTGANWLHGVIPVFPAGWDMSTITNISAPATCTAGSGVWAFYSSCTGTGSGQTFGPGFYYDTNSGGPLDGNPGNNYGDLCTNFPSSFTFCFDITIRDDCGGPTNPLDGNLLLPSVRITGDGISGSFYAPTATCANTLHPASDSNSNIEIESLTINCCDAEAGVSPGTLNICETGTYNLIGELGAPVDSGGYWTYSGPGSWTDASDSLGYGTFDPTVDPAGDYTYHAVYIAGIDTCESTSTISMEFIDYGTVQNIADCSGTPSDLNILTTEFPIPTGGTWYYNYGLPGQITVANGIIDPNVNSPGIYTYEFYDPGNCKTIFSVQVTFATGGAAGCTNTVDICTSDPACFSPFNALGCNPTAGGNWIVYDSLDIFLDYMPAYNVCLPRDSLFYNANLPSAYHGDVLFQYVLGAPPCSPAFVDVNVNVYEPANTGDFTITSICVNDAPVILETLLNGTVDPGLTWTDLATNTVIPNLFDPSVFAPNTNLNLEYAGGLDGTSCHHSTLLQLTILPDYAYAGDDNTITVCESDPPFFMTDSLLPNPGTGDLPQNGGTWTDPNSILNGDYFVPGTSAPGVYNYNITSSCATDDSYLTIIVLPTPVPGTSGTLDICDDELNVQLSDGLGAPFDAGGNWTLAGIGAGATVDGNTVTDGAVYTYTVGTPPCELSSTVTINLMNAPDAGVLTSAPQNYCDSDAPFALMSLFTTNPSVMNSSYWNGPTGPTTTVDPSLGPIATGTYTYTIPDGGCGSVSVSIDITIENVPNAGTDASVTACPNGAGTIDLLQALGNPAAGGTWISVPPTGPTNGIFNPALNHPAGDYTYQLSSASGTCTDEATVTVQYQVLSFPGNDTTITVCSSDPAFNMISVMTPGAVQGTWSGGTASPGIFNPAVDGSGTFTNSVVSGACPALTANLTINVTPLGDPGIDATTSLCSTMGNIDLTSYLNGTPDANGVWTDQTGTVVVNPYNITGSCGNSYTFTYTVGTGSCSASSSLNLDVICPPNAGSNGSISVCSDAANFSLYGGINGPYDTGGIWSDSNGNLTEAQATNMDPSTLSNGDAFTYTVSATPCTPASAEVVVNITPAMTATAIDASCTASQTTYIVNFVITGGQGPYAFVSGDGGTITGSSFTSNPITAGNAYSIVISDASSCGNLTVSGVSPVCACPVDAALTNQDQTICVGSSVDLTVSLSGAVGGNAYTVVYDDGTIPLTTVNNLNSGDILATVSPTTTTTYTLSSVTDGNCNGSVSGSVTITVEQLADAGADHTLDFCGDGSVIVFTPEPGEPTGGVFAPTQITATPANSGVYPYTMAGNQCPDDVANYTVNIDPQLATAGVQTACSASQTDYTVTFNITGGSGVGTYTVDGNSIPGSTFTSLPITLPNAGGYSFSVDDGGPCGPVIVSGSAPNCNCPVSASFGSANQTICTGSSADIIINLSGGTDGDYVVEYSAGGPTLPPLTNLSDGYLLTVSPTTTTTYSLVSAADGNCTGSVSGSVTITVENLPNAGGDHTVDYCGDGSTLNLMDVVTAQNEPTGGSFSSSQITLLPGNSGVYPYTMAGNQCPDDVANYTINIQDELVATSISAVCEPNQTEYTVEFVISGGTPPYTVNGNISGANFSETLNFAANPNYTYTISDNGPCADVVVSAIAPDCNCIAEGSITGTTTVCLGDCATITLHLIGDPPFNVSYQNGNSGALTNLTGIADGHQITVCPTVANTYTLISVSDSYCDGVVSGNPVQVNVNNPFSITNVTQICSNTAESYQLQFNINGGTPPYNFAGASGVYNTSVNPNIFLSNAIPSGNGYTITVTDGGVCPAQQVTSAAYSCACISDAGSLPATPVEVCEGSSFSISTNGSETLDGNDIIQYILHDGSSNSIGNIIASSADGTFTFNYSNMEPGAVYYINAVVGNNLGNGNVDLNGACTSVSNGTSVIMNALPTAAISGGSTVCAGETVDLSIQFTGEGPWDFTYAVDGLVQINPNYSSTNQLTLTATQPGTYTIETISDNNCSGSGMGSASIQNFETPTANLSGDPEVCEGSGDGPEVVLSGDGPWTFVYSIDGVDQAPVTTNYPTYTIPAEVGGTYAMVSLEGSNCTGTVSGTQNITVLASPTATISGGGSVCAGQSATFDVDLTGIAPWTVQYTVDGVPQPALTNLDGNYSFDSSVDGDYVIVSVNDANCSGNIIESQASLSVNPLPTAEITSSQSSVCIGQEVDLGIDLEGVPPYSMTYVLNNDTISVTGLYGDFMETLEPQSPLTLEVLFVSDGSNPACSSEPNAYMFIDANVLPNAPVLNNDTICDDNGPVQIGVSAAPGLVYSWSPQDNLSDPTSSNPIYTPTKQGVNPKTYRYILTASNGQCSAQDTAYITVDPGPIAKFIFSPNPVKNVDPTVHFTNTSIAGPGTAFFWVFDSLGTSTETNPTYEFPDDVNSKYNIELTAIDPATGCMDTHSDIVTIKPEMLVYVPTAFTPDGDGLNDLWGPVLSNVDPNEYKLTVYDRLGQVVFMTHDIHQKWNGGNNGDSYYVEEGVYVWMIETKNEISLEEVTLKGQVTVVR